MERKKLFNYVIDYFKRTMPNVESELQYSNPFELLVAVILSAQCTDKRVNIVTPHLFLKYPDAFSMSGGKLSDIYEIIKSISYPNSKSRYLLEMSKMLVEKYGGKVPSTTEDLVKLPGVGRKTANVVQAVIWGKATFAVDTHIYRVSHRLGLVSDNATTPYSVEKILTANIPDDLIPQAHHWLLLHGRYVCQSRKAKCDICGLVQICNSYNKEKNN